MNQPGHPLLSTRQLLASLALALIVGVALTVLVILPAETGKDPAGAGALTGLDRLAAGEVDNAGDDEAVKPGPTVAEGSTTLYTAIDPATTRVRIDEYGESQPAAVGTNLRRHDSAYRSDSIDIHIDTDAAVEYKAIMDQGEMLLYAWQADGELYYDFHAHQSDANPDFWTRYAEGEAANDQGSIVAPYTGEHGWYWLNIEGRPVTVKLSVAGYHKALKAIDLSATGEE